MKKYIILSYSISGVGGGQMYQKNKLNYMKKRGYTVSAVYSIAGQIIINDLKQYENNLVELLSINPMLISQRLITEVIDNIIQLTGILNEETIIETNNKILSMWGEIIAKKYNCKNIIYIIDEKIGSLDTIMIDFFEFKRSKNEIYGIKEETYKMIFGSNCSEDYYQYILPLVCNNVIDDYEHPVINSFVRSEFNIGTIGRLEKAYIPTLISEIKRFAKKHEDLSITFLMIGESPKNENIDLIKRTFSNLDNVKVILTGALFPIPLSLLKNLDVFVSSAGSARVSASINKPTITIDARDYNSIGILNYDTNNTVFRTTEEKIPISEKLDFIFENDLYKKINLKTYDKKVDDIELVFKIHFESIQNIKKDKQYYNFLSKKLSYKRKMEKIFLNIFGFNAYQKLRKYIFSRISSKI